MRIVSLLPAATELACALGLEAQLVGISAECDCPASITHLPRAVRARIDSTGFSPSKIDQAVREGLAAGHAPYMIDEELLAALQPDIILTQDLCDVCAPTTDTLAAALRGLKHKPEILFLSPATLLDIEANLKSIAQATSRETLADQIIGQWHARLKAIPPKPLVRVVLLEWADPIYSAGHWMPEMVERAGGVEVLGKKGELSRRIEWGQVLNAAPEVVIFAPCGYNAEQAQEQMPLLQRLPRWESLPAARNGRVHAVDANAYFARPGPRVIDGIELLSRLFE